MTKLAVIPVPFCIHPQHKGCPTPPPPPPPIFFPIKRGGGGGGGGKFFFCVLLQTTHNPTVAHPPPPPPPHTFFWHTHGSGGGGGDTYFDMDQYDQKYGAREVATHRPMLGIPPHRRMIRLIEGNAKCCHLKKIDL
jgi:hypothetical protein